MPNKEKNVCRLCLTTSSKNFDLIEEYTKDVFDILLLKVNLSITERAVLCSDCSENSHRFFQFKSNCLSTEELIVSFAITENTGIIDVKDVYNKENDSILDVDYVVCRLCINSMKKNFTTLEVAKAEHPILEEMLPKCLPEVDFKITSDPILCTSCLSVLLKYFNFIVKCCDTEKKINTYFEQSGMIKNKLELHKIVHYLLEDKSPILPTEDDYETQIKHESIDIKLEDPETMYQCDICDYNTFDEESLRQHIIAHVINRPGDDQEYADLQKGFNKRQLILDKLRKRVNFNNFNAVDKMGDTTSSHTIRNDHLPCPCCKAFFSRRSMSRHIRMACPEKPQDEPQLLNHQQLMACDVPKLKVFPRMKFNECTRFLRNDKLVLRFADHLLSEKLKKSQMKGVTDKLKLLGNFMLEMKKINPAITDLTSALHPSHYDDMKKSFVIMVQLEKPIKKESIVVSLSEVLRWVAAFFKADLIVEGMSKNIQDVNRLIKMLDNQLEAGNSSGTRNEPKRSLKEKDVKDSDGNVDLSGVLDLDLSEEQLNKEIYGGCFDVRVEEVNNTQSENCDTGESEKCTQVPGGLKDAKGLQEVPEKVSVKIKKENATETPETPQLRSSNRKRRQVSGENENKVSANVPKQLQNGEPPIKRKKSTIFIGEDQNKVNKVYANIPEQSQNGEPPRRREKSTRLRILGENKNGGSTNTFEHSQGTGVQQNMQPLEFLQVAKIKRRAWKDEEKRKMMELFGDYIKRKELPSLNNCLEVATVVPELSTRTGQQIRLFVSNEINRRKAAKNHQNGARRSEWTAEETSILQKIFKKYINGELYPSGQEIEEAMKKYPVLANRTNVIIKSKIQYEKKKRKLALNNYL